MKRPFLSDVICAALILAIMGLSCTFSRPDTTPLTLSEGDGWSDTTDLWPTFRLALSVPLADSIAALELSPGATGGYQSYLCPTRDTLVLAVTAPEGLPGGTAYVLRPTAILTATNGSTLDPGDAEFTFLTLPSERESNDLPAYADTIQSARCGVLYPAHDTDYYFWPEPCEGRLRCTPLSGSLSITAVDTAGGALSVSPQTDGSVLVTPPATNGIATLIVIYPLQAGTCRYRITPEEIP